VDEAVGKEQPAGGLLEERLSLDILYGSSESNTPAISSSFLAFFINERLIVTWVYFKLASS
jgi:hypothetical protein